MGGVEEHLVWRAVVVERGQGADPRLE